MKRKLSLALVIVLVLSILAGCGSTATQATAGETQAPAQTTAAVTSAADTGDRAKISVMLRGSETSSAYKVWSSLLDGFIAEKGYDLDVEYELLPNDGDYANKLQLYISSNQLPDIFGAANGTFSSAAKAIGSLVCVQDEMTKLGNFDQMNPAVADFFADADDGKVWLFPESFNDEFFFYRKDIFAKYNLNAPTNWDEFLQVCDTLKKNGEIPVVIAGAEQWQIMRYLSFIPWRVTHDKFIMNYIGGQDKFSANAAAQKGVNLVKTMGEKGYWQPSFTSTNYTDAVNMFFGGQGTILYSGSWLVSNASEMYKNGQLGLFPVPDAPGLENMTTNIPIHGGFATAFNAQTYDKVMQEFFAYATEHYGNAAYEAGMLSPFSEPIPDTMDPLYKEVRALADQSTAGWVSWDDKLDAATLVAMADAQQQLALGMINEQEFISQMDSQIKGQ